MALVDLNTLETGQVISFRTLDPTDGVTWEGKIVGIAAYVLVSGLADLMPAYRAILKHIPTMPAIDKLSYLVIQYTQDGKVAKKVVAKEWIDPSSVKIIERTMYLDIRVFERPASETQTILDLLSSHGFKATCVGSGSVA